MAAIDLFSLEPQKLSRDLKGIYLQLYGAEKCGKTSLAAQFEKALICAFEPGSNALNNVYVQPVKTWADFKKLVRQLNDDRCREKFDYIVLDIVDIAYDLCQKYICIQNDIETINQIPWGGGFKMVDDEFYDTIREIMFAGYGIIFISHETEREMTRDSGETYTKMVPSPAKRCAKIVNGLVDVIGYLKNVNYVDENGQPQSHRYIYLRDSDNFLAGSRFQPIEPRIEMSYESLSNAILDAIEKTATTDGTEVTNMPNPFAEPDFDSLISEAKLLWGKVIQKEKQPEATAILEEVFGKPTKFSEILPEDVSKLNQAISQIKSIL